MSKVFEQTTLAGIPLQNRILRSATHEGLGDSNGRPREELGNVYQRLAQGGVGAIITGYVGVHPNGRTLPNMPMLHKDEYVEDYRKILAPLTTLGTPVIMQLAHGGGQISPAMAGGEVLAPSRHKYPLYGATPRAMETSEIQEVIDSFVQCVRRAKEAGFAGVQFHAAHGYLLSQFLSPHCNHRTDQWGGSTEGRFKIIAAIIQGVRQVVGPYPLFIKLSASDGDKNGMTVAEAIEIAKLFAAAGGAGVEVSCGGIGSFFEAVRVPKPPVEAIMNLELTFSKKSAFTKGFLSLMAPIIIKTPKPLHNYNVAAASEIKKHVEIPVIVVGGLRKIKDMETVLDNGQADYISLSRPLIIEPALVNNFRAGKQDQSRCIDCAYCLPGVTTAPLRCYYGKLS